MIWDQHKRNADAGFERHTTHKRVWYAISGGLIGVAFYVAITLLYSLNQSLRSSLCGAALSFVFGAWAGLARTHERLPMSNQTTRQALAEHDARGPGRYIARQFLLFPTPMLIVLLFSKTSWSANPFETSWPRIVVAVTVMASVAGTMLWFDWYAKRRELRRKVQADTQSRFSPSS